MITTIVVGAGAAGIPLATRLSQDPHRDVLLIEAGSGDPTPPDLLDASAIRAAMPGHPANWNFHGNLTPDLAYLVARGKLLGGSSAINGGYFVRARPSDFNAWAEAGGQAWNYDAVAPLLAGLERDLDMGDRPGHGLAGPMPVQRPAQHNPISQALLAGAEELGYDQEPDKNAADSAPGAGPVPSNIVDGIRVNTARAYLTCAVRDSLEIRAGLTAQRVLFSHGRAAGVMTDRGPLMADEVVLAAGAIGTPTLLMRSGIGPREDLNRLGIDMVADLPVGRAFHDHPDLALGWRATQSVFDPAEGFLFPTALNFASGPDHPEGDLEILACVKPFGYMLTGSTEFVSGAAAQVARHPVRTAKALAGSSVKRMSAQIAHGQDYQLTVGLQSATGRGTLSLTSADPTAPPRIDYHYLEDADDKRRLRMGIRAARALLETSAFSGLYGGMTEVDDATVDDDDALDAWMRKHLGTAIHMCASAPMGQVTDGAGRVYDVPGLRVADTSILPSAPTRGPNATAVFIGEFIAGQMLADSA